MGHRRSNPMGEIIRAQGGFVSASPANGGMDGSTTSYRGSSGGVASSAPRMYSMASAPSTGSDTGGTVSAFGGRGNRGSNSDGNPLGGIDPFEGLDMSIGNLGLGPQMSSSVQSSTVGQTPASGALAAVSAAQEAGILPPSGVDDPAQNRAMAVLEELKLLYPNMYTQSGENLAAGLDQFRGV